MLDGFHKNYNVHALNRILKPVYVPDAQLAIGEAETLAPVAKKVHYPYIPKTVVEPELATQSYEYTQIDGFAEAIKEDDFPKNGIFGDAIGAIGGV